METHKIIVKFFAEDGSAAPSGGFVPIFHSWIQQQAIAEHLLIDVADYQHVSGGPGTVLVGHEANFSTDGEDGKLGLMYTRKQPGAGDFFARLKQAFRACLQGCARLEADAKLRFKTDQAILRLNDRLLAPNSAETYKAVEPDVLRLVQQLYPNSDLHLEHCHHPQRLFEIQIKTNSAPPIAALLDRLA
jgi:hypothetical protein